MHLSIYVYVYFIYLFIYYYFLFFVKVNFDKVFRKEIKPPFSSLPEMDVRQGTEDDVNPIGNENDITDTVFEDF